MKPVSLSSGGCFKKWNPLESTAVIDHTIAQRIQSISDYLVEAGVQ
jgi:hypothetical protein